MTKRHFVALAEVFRAVKPELPSGFEDAQTYAQKCAHFCQWERDRDAMALFCQAQNPQFDRERWLGYIEGTCGQGGNVDNLRRYCAECGDWFVREGSSSRESWKYPGICSGCALDVAERINHTVDEEDGECSN